MWPKQNSVKSSGKNLSIIVIPQTSNIFQGTNHLHKGVQMNAFDRQLLDVDVGRIVPQVFPPEVSCSSNKMVEHFLWLVVCFLTNQIGSFPPKCEK